MQVLDVFANHLDRQRTDADVAQVTEFSSHAGFSQVQGCGRSLLPVRLDDGGTRLKGMSQRTYDGLLTTPENCEERRDSFFGMTVMQLFGHKF